MLHIEPQSNIEVRPRSFLPARSKGMVLAKAEKAAISPISRKSSTKMSCGGSAAGSASRSLMKKLRKRRFTSRRKTVRSCNTFARAGESAEPLFRQVGIYSHVGQLYEPVDKETLLYYKEVQDGQILEEGITEAGSMSSFIAAGTAYATHRINMIPFFIFYSMFGFQRVGDLIWAAGDSRAKGFMLGGTSGRTTLAGEGLQHQDGNSHLLAYPLPNLKAYDPAFAFELAVIIRDGLRRMYEQQENIFYYLTVMNENYAHPAMPDVEGVEDGILKGMYKFKSAENPNAKLHAQLFGSGAILNETLKAQALLAEKYQIAA